MFTSSPFLISSYVLMLVLLDRAELFVPKKLHTRRKCCRDLRFALQDSTEIQRSDHANLKHVSEADLKRCRLGRDSVGLAWLGNVHLTIR